MAIKEYNLTEGKISSVLMKFVMPFIVMNLLHVAYTLTDLFVIGHFTKDSAAISGVTIGAAIIILFMFFVFGFAAGLTVLVGRAFGAKNYEEMDRLVFTSMTMFLMVGVAIMLILLIFAPLFTKLMYTPADAVDETITYIRINALGMLFVMAFNCIGGVLRGVGNSTTPLLYIGISSVCNIVLDIIFVCYWDMSVAGVSYATIIAQFVAYAVAVYLLRSRGFRYKFYLKDFRFAPKTAKAIWDISIPISLQNILASISFLILFALANDMGIIESAAFGINNRLYSLTLLPAYSFATALTAIAAQTMGAGMPERAKKALLLASFYAFVPCCVFFLFELFTPHLVMRIFTADEAIIESGSLLLFGACWEIFLISFLFCLNDFFNGCGHTRFTFVVNVLASFPVRLSIAYFLVFQMEWGILSLGLASSITTALVILVYLWYLRSNRWQKFTLPESTA
ncbi:MAG: MATE family efflux transporter [Alphaproteobacteria bacterium]|nr:MATE family efflux transporter [Alphaproteobacteria bacterium]